MGLHISITRTENASSVGGSYSLFTRSARIIRIIMMQARVTDGVKPTTAAKRISDGAASKNVRNRFFSAKVWKRPNRIVTCRPDTAIICRMPLTARSDSVL